MNLNDEVTLMGYLEDALDSEHGIKLILESPDEMRRLRQKLYKTRGTDPRYRTLVLSEHEHELWIVKKDEKALT